MHIKRVLQHTKRAVLACCERSITFVPEIIWRVTYGFQCFVFDCSRVKQDNQATSGISMVASAKIGCSIFTGDILLRKM